MITTPIRSNDDYDGQSVSTIVERGTMPGTLIVFYGLRITPHRLGVRTLGSGLCPAWVAFNDVVKKGTFRLLRREGL